MGPSGGVSESDSVGAAKKKTKRKKDEIIDCASTGVFAVGVGV